MSETSGMVAVYVQRARRGRGATGTGVRYTGLSLEVLPRALRGAGQAAMVAAAQWWRKNRMPVKFTVQAYAQYGGRENDVYEERKGTPPWMVRALGAKREQRRAGLVRPLYRSGNLRRAVLNNELRTRATGSGRGLKVRAWFADLPRYTYMYKPGHTQVFNPNGRRQRRVNNLEHDKVRELSAMNEADVQQMREAYGRAVKTEIKKLNAGTSGGEMRQ